MGAGLNVKDILSIAFVAISMIGLIGGFANRMMLRKGLGTQFIRYVAIVVALPVAAALALQGMLTEAAVSVVLGALGYVFAGAGKSAD